jgi:hypothetical protein
MRKMDRKQALKAGAGGALALGALATAEAAAADDEEREAVFVHIHGVLTRATATLAISIDVAGTEGDLAGAGWDSGTTQGPQGMVPGTTASGPGGACYYTAAGRLEREEGSRKVHLQGRSLFTNRTPPAGPPDSEEPGRFDTRADGRRMIATADARTGEIHWTLVAEGTAPTPADFFSGVGTVTVMRGGHSSRPG